MIKTLDLCLIFLLFWALLEPEGLQATIELIDSWLFFLSAVFRLMWVESKLKLWHFKHWLDWRVLRHLRKDS